MKKMQSSRREKIKSLMLGFLVMLFLNSVNAWNFVSVDYGTTYGRDSLALDSNGNPCYIYSDNLSRFFYGCWNGNSFYDVKILENNISGMGGFTLALDNNDIPHICLVNVSNDLTYYVLSGSEFIKNINITSSQGGCGIDTDKNNNPHIVYGNGNDVKESFLSAGTWITSTIYTMNGLIGNPYIRISQDDMKYVLFKQDWGGAGSYAVHFANSTFDSVDWEDTQLEGSATPNVYIGDLEMYNNYAYMSYRHSALYTIAVQDALHSNNKINLDTSVATIFSLAIQENVYAVYVSGGNIHLVTNETGSYQDTVEFGDSTGVPTVAIDEDINKWVLDTDDSGANNVVRLAYEKPLYTISGTIYNSVTIDEIENAYICFNDGVNDYCDYSDVNGDYDIDLFSGSYDLLITKSGYDDYSDSGINFNSDLTNNHYYINPEGVTVENESSIVLTFLHYLDNTPIVSETMELHYISGCDCLVGNKYYYTTDSEGKITQVIYKGIYEVSPKGDYLIYSERNNVYTTVIFTYIDIDDYAKVFKLKPYSAVDNLVYGKTKDATTGQNLANITVAIYNAYNYYEDLSNESGDYQLLDVNAGTYYIYAYDSKSPIEYEKTSEDLILVENQTEQDLYLYPKIKNDTIILRWNITDCSDESSLANVTTVMEDSGGLPVYYNSSSEIGIAEISGIERGFYNISHRKSGYITQSAEYNHQLSYNLSICLREMGIELCYKVNGTIYADDGSTPLQLAEFRVKNEYGTLLTYITDATGIYDTGKEVGGRCLEEGYYTLEVIREGYNTYSELIFLDANLTSHNITMNESEDKVIYTVVVADKNPVVVASVTAYIPIENALVNLTEEWLSNLSINKICYHPDSHSGCVFSNLRKGHYIVEITADGYNSEKFRKYITGDTKSVVLLDETEPHFSLKVQVTGYYPNSTTSITGLRDSEVTLYKLIDWNFPDDFTKIRTEKSGIGGFLWFDNLVKDVYKVEAKKDYYYSNEEEVFLDTDKEIVIFLESSGDIIVEDMKVSKEKAEIQIQSFLYTYTPTFLMIMFLLFLMSAVNKVNAPSSNRYT